MADETQLADSNIVSRFIKRFEEMNSQRTKFEGERITDEVSFDADVNFDEDENWLANDKTEQSLIRFEMGRTEDTLVFDVVPQPDAVDYEVERADGARRILETFLENEGFRKEYRAFRHDRAKYGSAILFCGLRQEQENRYVEDSGELYGKKNKIETLNKYFFTPVRQNIRHFRVDDSALWQNNFRKAVDCVRCILYSEEEAKNIVSMFGKDIDVSATLDNEDITSIRGSKGHVVFFEYYNRVTKDYWIIINKRQLLYSSKYTYSHGMLPFSMAQYGYTTKCMYGISLGSMIRYEKGMKNTLLDTLFSGSKLNASKVVLGDLDTGVPIQAVPGAITAVNVNDSVANYNAFDTSVDLNATITALQVIKDMIKENSGIDLQVAYEVKEDTLGQTEIKEENKAIISRSSDSGLYEALDDALTMSLSNIRQFAPKKLAVWSDKSGTKVITEYPKLQIKGAKVKQTATKLEFTEDIGKYGTLELKDDTIPSGILVKVITPGTYSNVNKVIQKNRYNEMVTSISTLIKSGVPAEQIFDQYPIEDILRTMRIAYGFSQTTQVQETQKSKLERENKKKEKAILSGLGTQLNVQEPDQTPQRAVSGNQNEQQPQETAFGL